MKGSKEMGRLQEDLRHALVFTIAFYFENT